jgi:hypothetical protein
MATTDKDTSGGRRRRRRKTGTRKSRPYIGPEQYGGFLPNNTQSGSIGDFLNGVLQGGAQQVKKAANTAGVFDPPGGKKMDRVERPTTFEPRPRPAADITNDRAAIGDGYSATQQFMDLATSLLTQPGASYDYESAQREAAGAIRQAYGAEIAAIRQNNRVARKSSKHARKEIEHLYKGLSKMYGKQEAKATRQGNRAANQQMGIAEEGNTILSDLNNQMIQDETSMLQELGQQQAAGELISPDYDRMGSQIADNTEMGTRAASRATSMGQNNARWFDRAQGGARLEGRNAQADMIAQLQGYLMDNRNQIAGLKGDRAQEIAASNMNIESQAAEAANDAQQQTFDNVMKLLGVSTDIEDTNYDNQLAASKFRWDKKMDRRDLKLDMLKAAQQGNTEAMDGYSPGIRDAMSIIAKQQDPGDQNATEALWKLFASNAWRTGEVALPNGETTDLTPYEAAAQARKVGVRMGLQGRQLQEFINAAAASVR